MLTLRLMGGVEVARDGEPVALPRSKKTRALLAYLAMTGRAHRRDHLCAMFWDLPDDPRGALRWSLSRLRPLVNDPETARIVADRDTVRFDPAGVHVDVLAVRRRCAAGLAAIETSELQDFAQVLQGAFLDGLFLPRCDGFQSWCIAEREDARALHGEILRALISRLSAEPCAALRYARSLVQVDPLDEAAHADLCSMLARAGYRTQAEQQLATANRLLADAGIKPSAALEKVRGAVDGSACSRPVPPLPTPALNLPISDKPATHYAKSGGVHVAYQVFGDGPVDLVLTPGFVSHIENYWDEPGFARALRRLGTVARVTMFDKRGTGLSDQVGDLPGLDERMDDIRAVMDAVGLETAAIMGISEGGSLSAMFAASHPDRCRSLILYGAFARFTSWFPTAESLRELFRYIDEDWGTGKTLANFAPSMAGNADFQHWWGKFERLGANPGAAAALMKMNSEIDISDILPTIRVPTIVIHRTGDVTIDVEDGRFLGEQIPGARYVELPGDDHLFFVGDNTGKIIDLIGSFIAEAEPAGLSNRVLATIVHAEIEGGHGNRFRPAHDALASELARFRGKATASPVGRFRATFDGPARAIHCALSIAGLLRLQGVTVRIGVHTGEVDMQDGQVDGVAADIAAGVARFAGPGEVVISRTVRDLIAGSGIELENAGKHRLNGVADLWHLYRAAD